MILASITKWYIKKKLQNGKNRNWSFCAQSKNILCFVYWHRRFPWLGGNFYNFPLHQNYDDPYINIFTTTLRRLSVDSDNDRYVEAISWTQDNALHLCLYNFFTIMALRKLCRYEYRWLLESSLDDSTLLAYSRRRQVWDVTAVNRIKNCLVLVKLSM